MTKRKLDRNFNSNKKWKGSWARRV